jgi:hypothetical protein
MLRSVVPLPPGEGRGEGAVLLGEGRGSDLPLPPGEGRGEGASIPLALVEVPPFGAFGGALPEPALRARLSPTKEWFVETPVALRLEDGIVVEIETNSERGDPGEPRRRKPPDRTPTPNTREPDREERLRPPARRGGTFRRGWNRPGNRGTVFPRRKP